jgi:hypothetical protein
MWRPCPYLRPSFCLWPSTRTKSSVSLSWSFVEEFVTKKGVQQVWVSWKLAQWQSYWILRGLNKLQPVFPYFMTDSGKTRYRYLTVIPLSRCECLENRCSEKHCLLHAIKGTVLILRISSFNLCTDQYRSFPTRTYAATRIFVKISITKATLRGANDFLFLLFASAVRYDRNSIQMV